MLAYLGDLKQLFEANSGEVVNPFKNYPSEKIYIHTEEKPTAKDLAELGITTELSFRNSDLFIYKDKEDNAIGVIWCEPLKVGRDKMDDGSRREYFRAFDKGEWPIILPLSNRRNIIQLTKDATIYRVDGQWGEITSLSVDTAPRLRPSYECSRSEDYFMMNYTLGGIEGLKEDFYQGELHLEGDMITSAGRAYLNSDVFLAFIKEHDIINKLRETDWDFDGYLEPLRDK